MPKVLIAGCGYLGSALGLRLAREGCNVSGIRRDPSKLPQEIEGIAANLCDTEGLRRLKGPYDYVVYCAGTSEHSEAGYRRAYLDGPRALLAAMRDWDANPRRILFTSSTAVYGQTDGEWVDEDSPTEAAHFAGRIMREAEELFLGGAVATVKNSNIERNEKPGLTQAKRGTSADGSVPGFSTVPTVVLRLGGIYGPGRTRLIETVRDGLATIAGGSPRYLNLNHRDDCTAAIQHLLELPEPAPIYLGVDDCPADRAEILRWIAEQLGVPAPQVASSDTDASSGGNKRCANMRLRATGFRFAYPTYRDGYASLIAAMQG